ncbi:hypothetical protein WJX72_010246 [[Myrmecia] bisecta]|uniref:Bardet-Biedl syndrome 2 protein homolog n=1 Tax=[Myrmecia] bisecta TaxID=41462 RepID=A0AAW1Q3G5_9CHLO
MLIPAFQLHLTDAIQQRAVTVGKYDGVHPALTAATTGGKVFIHSPHQEQDQPQTQYLNINKQITALTAGALEPALGRDLLLVGTPNHLQAYDVHKNQDFFFKEVAEGVNVVILGIAGTCEAPLAIVGCNGSVQGFDAKGQERFWTVTGSNVSALALCDADGDGQNELLVGSEDFSIRIFKGENVISEIIETDRVIGLTPIHHTRFGYALANGTIGVYEQSVRAWRVKSKHSVGAISSYDLDGDGIPELISGWSNGRMEVRSDATGEVIYKDILPCSISGIVRGDYRCDGTDQIIVCSTEGEVRGYLPADPEVSGRQVEETAHQVAIAELSQRRQELLVELQNYDAQIKAAAGQQERGPGLPLELGGQIPAITKVAVAVRVSEEARSCSLHVQTNSEECVIRGVVIFADQVFEGESLFHYPNSPAPTADIPLKLKKDVAVMLLVKVLVALRTSAVYHVFEEELQLSRYAMYASSVRGFVSEPESYVTFATSERVSRLAMWLEHSFPDWSASAAGVGPSSDSLRAAFVSLRDGKPLIIAMTARAGGQVTIRTDSMELAADLVQEIAAYLAIEQLDCQADFPPELAAFALVLDRVDELNAARLKMTGAVADSSNVIKSMLVKAEDARILGNMPSMKKLYGRLMDLNRELVMEHEKRATNHHDLLEALRLVNTMIQRAARLRVGEPKARVVAACRQAVKANNVQALLKIIREGHA